MRPFRPSWRAFTASLFTAIISILCAAPGSAQPSRPQTAGELAIETPWARATPPNARTGAVYFTLSNHGNAADRLLSASSAAADRVELHAHVNEGGVMRMKAVDAIALAPGERVSLRPGGLHVMLIDLKGPLRENGRLTVTLRFASAGEIAVEVPILRNPPAGAGGHAH